MDVKALFQISYGVYVISSQNQGKLNCMIATTVCQVTSEPIKITVTVNKQNLTHEFIWNSKYFSVSMLSKETPFEFIGKIGFRTGRGTNKFQNTNYSLGVEGTPIVLNNAIGFLECRVMDSMDVGTHTIFVADVVNAQILSEDEPLTYRYYHEVKGGKSPKTAPTYIAMHK